jgi:hypothetical protein
MPYPNILTPNSTEELTLPSGSVVHLLKATPTFRLWTGEPIGDTYGSKSILDLSGEPVFAELAILRLFQREGWEGVWVDSYRQKYRVGYWNKDNEVALPPKREDLLERIYQRVGGRKGCWDVYCWREGEVVFAESKRRRRDRIRKTQLRWMEAALDVGVPPESFLIVEWSLEEV